MEMDSKTWQQGIRSMAAAIALLGVIAVPAFAQKGKSGPSGSTIPVTTFLVQDCPPTKCATDNGGWDPVNGFTFLALTGTYSVLPAHANGNPDRLDATGDNSPNDGKYVPGPGVQSEILTHNTVFTLKTLDTLSPTGKVDDDTITVQMHFYNSFGIKPPDCWGTATPTTLVDRDGNVYTIYEADVTQAVNWSIFSENSMAFPDMGIYDPVTDRPKYPGFARLDFNIRNGSCENNIFRFYLRWSINSGGIKIKRLAEDQWEIATNEYGEATLDGQGGRKGQTQSFGSWRVPFQVILTAIPQ